MSLVRLPPQHGAWAFLIVPLILGALLGAASWPALVFAVAWVAAYPVSYFAGRAVVSRLRRGAWSRKARSELRSALPWAVIAVAGATTLVVIRPAVAIAGIGIAVVWTISLWLTWKGRERGITNDLLLVVLAAAAPVVMWFAGSKEPLAEAPSSIWLASVVTLLFFTGSVLHVKSLIREADDRRWHLASIGYHGIVVVGVAFASPWLLVAFVPALVRTIVMRPPLKPGVIGAVEIIMSALLVIGAVLAS